MLTKYKSFLTKPSSFKCLKTNIQSFDRLIGGGIPKGRILELVGDTDAGKTRFLFDIIESLKDEEVLIAYIATSTKSLGFLQARELTKNNNLVLCISNNEREIIDFVSKTIKEVDLFIIDSMPEILTENEMNGFDMKVNQDMPKLLSSLNTIMYGEDSALIAVNHFIFKNETNVSRWRNIFQQYCAVRIELNENNEFKLISHKLKPSLVNKGGIQNELRLG